MAVIYTPPKKIKTTDLDNHVVFLCGSIQKDEGLANDWNTLVCNELNTISNLTILNPRRKQWDSSWIQSIENPQFKEQVDWELDGIESAHTVIFYFDPETKSPITLYELGLVCQKPKNILLCCPDGFYRKGNVDIICYRNNIKQFQSLEELIKFSKHFFDSVCKTIK